MTLMTLILNLAWMMASATSSPPGYRHQGWGMTKPSASRPTASSVAEAARQASFHALYRRQPARTGANSWLGYAAQACEKSVLPGAAATAVCAHDQSGRIARGHGCWN